MRISDWSSDVCSSDLFLPRRASASKDRANDERPVLSAALAGQLAARTGTQRGKVRPEGLQQGVPDDEARHDRHCSRSPRSGADPPWCSRDHSLVEPRAHALRGSAQWARSEAHTSELQALMSISYAVVSLKKKK